MYTYMYMITSGLAQREDEGEEEPRGLCRAEEDSEYTNT